MNLIFLFFRQNSLGMINGKGEKILKIAQESYEIFASINNNFQNFQKERTLLFKKIGIKNIYIIFAEPKTVLR